MEIRFDSINVMDIRTNSGIFVGPNTQNGWSSHLKVNAALGTVVGDGNILCSNINVIHDEDMVDMPVRNETISEKQTTNGKGQVIV